MLEISFNRPTVLGNEIDAVKSVISDRKFGGDGSFAKSCERSLELRLGCEKVYLTHSCTAALEMAALLLELGPGDEVIVPSFTFSSTANAIVLRGAVPVFADIDPSTMNIDIDQIEQLIGPATKAIFVVHYAGRVPDMNRINAIASRHDLTIVEDAAQSLGSTYLGAPAGTHSQLSTFSFHETKNIQSGEGGALAINEARFTERAAIIREKGTNRSAFVEGAVDKYTWVDVGSSYIPSELSAAWLKNQLDAVDIVTSERRSIWQKYRYALEPVAATFGLELPALPNKTSQLNGHLFHILLPDAEQRPRFIKDMRARGIQCGFHYVPLHSSPAGRHYGKTPLGCPHAEIASARLVRLPIWFGLEDAQIERVVDSVSAVLKETQT